MDRRVLILSGSFFALAVGAGLSGAYLPLYVESLGGTMTAFGFLGTVNALCRIVLLPIVGYLTDSWGRRAAILLTLGIEAAAAAILVVAPIWWWLLGAMVLGELAQSMVRIPASAAIADLTKAAGRGRAFGTFSALSSLGGAAGPALASLVLLTYQLRAVFAMRLALSLAALVTAGRALGRWRPSAAEDDAAAGQAVPGAVPGAAERRQAPWSPRAWSGASQYLKPILPLVVAEAVSTFGCGMFYPFLAVHLQRGWRLEEAAVGLAFTGIALTTVMTSIAAGHLADRVGRVKVLVADGILCSAAALALWLGRGPAGLICACVLWGAQLGFWGPALESLLGDAVPAAERGKVRSILSGLCVLAFVPAPLAGGALIDRFGFTPSLVAVAIVGVVYAACVATIARRPVARAYAQH